MATKLQDIIAKKAELQKTNPNATNIDARNALAPAPQANMPNGATMPIAPQVTPVAPATPPVTPEAPTPSILNKKTQGTATPNGSTLTPEGTIIQSGEANTKKDTSGIPPSYQGAATNQKEYQQIPYGSTKNPDGSFTTQDGKIISTPESDRKNPSFSTDVTAFDAIPGNIEYAGDKKTQSNNGIDYTQAKGREAEITANLDSFKAKGMSPDEIMRASDYANASPEKKALIEPYLKQTVPTASAMYNAIVAKADIPEAQKLTPSYKIAQNRYTKANMFSGMTASQLANEMKNVKLVEGSRAFDDLKAMNPKLVQDATNLRKVNGGTSNIWTYTNNPDGTPVKVNNLENTFVDDFNDNFGDFIKSMYKVQTPEEIRAIIYTSDVQDAENKAKSIELDINKIDDALDIVDKDVEAELAGTGATGSRIALEKASRKDKLNDQRASLERNYTTYANKANNLITQNTSAYQTEQTQKQAQNAAMLPFITDQYKTEQAKRQAEQALNDPATAIKSVMDEMEKIGVTSTESLQTKVQKAQDYIANGGTLGGYIDEMKKLYAEKPEYKAYIAKQGGTEWQSTNITRYNPATGANESTPVFYRKKTDGSFEAVDLSGNKIDASLIGGGTSGTPGSISATGDMSGLASNYPYEASFKNNNTSGITWGMSANTKKLLENAGIKISEGTARPSREGGKYVKFDNIADGILAHKILLSQAGSDDINARLQQWVGTKEGPTYAKNLMDQAGIKDGTKFSQLTPEQLDKLVMVQIKKESPGMYKELTKGTTTGTTTVQSNPLQVKEFEAYNGTTIPAQYKTPLEQDDFVKRYNEWRASRPGTKIESGNDILNIKIDKPTEGQSASQSYTSRMLNAVNNLMPLEKKFLELGTRGQVTQTYLPSLLKSSDQKMMDAEKKNFITAVLRKQSGASIAPSEFAGEELKYFPQPGDSKEVVIAKQNARNAEIKAMLATAGVDAEGNSLSKYYNPPIISSETIITTPAETYKITTLKNTYFPSK